MLALYPNDFEMQSSAVIQIVKYKAKVLRHSFSMSNINNPVVGDVKLATRELRQKPSTALQHLKSEGYFLPVVPCPKSLPKL
ncbi:MAG: hypothetical protein ACI8Z9_000232 [Paraglaciecola sp.]|jgi:hypothetical protein